MIEVQFEHSEKSVKYYPGALCDGVYRKIEVFQRFATKLRHMAFGYERVHLPLYKVADTPFISNGDDIMLNKAVKTLTISLLDIAIAYKKCGIT